jgi:hypothetical protein
VHGCIMALLLVICVLLVVACIMLRMISMDITQINQRRETMKELKAFYGYRYSNDRKSSYRMTDITEHTVTIYWCEPNNYGNGWYSHDTELLTIRFLSNAKPEYKRSEIAWFGFALQTPALDLCYNTDKVLSLITKFAKSPTRKGLVSFLKSIKAERIYYHGIEHRFIPRKFQRVEKLYLDAFKAGYSLAA